MPFKPDHLLWSTALLAACAVADEPDVEVETAELAARPSPGDAGIGDPLFPTLGNGGYDVEHYDLDLRYATAAIDQGIDGTVTITARATQALSRFNLDFAGATLGAVEVDDCHATYTWDGSELVITPARAIRRGDRFTVKVSHFTSLPKVPSAEDFLGAPFFITPDGTAVAAQPAGAHLIFPSNDHPKDKASFSFRLDVPAGTTAVANGDLTSQRTRHGRTVWRYEQSEPMATELTQIVVGAFSVLQRGTQHGVKMRDVVPTRLVTPELDAKLATAIDHMGFLEQRLGDYPFSTYGSLLTDSSLGFALETQGLSLFESSFFESDFVFPIMVHELAHQWFGDSVAPTRWADVWQNEGHATWYELDFQLDNKTENFVGLMQLVYSLGDEWRQFFGPVGAPPSGDVNALFNPNVYYGGALVLFALRQQIGVEAFERLERTWVTRYRGKSASTADFIALASEISGSDQTAFLTAWLYGTTTPAMPGHPDWVVDPIPAPEPAARAARVARTARMKGLPFIRH
jgi:aminopeptidase N